MKNNFMNGWVSGVFTGFLLVATFSMVRLVNLAEKAVDLHFSNPAPPPFKISARPIQPLGEVKPK